jgi:hypothetical protein
MKLIDSPKGVSVVIPAQQQVDAGLAVVIAVPVVHLLGRQLVDAQLRDRDDAVHSRQGRFLLDPTGPERKDNKAVVGPPQVLEISDQGQRMARHP